MANKKISELPIATTPLSGAEEMEIVQGGINKRVAVSGGSWQPLDSDLTAIAALTPSNDDVIQRKSGAWTNRTIAQLKADLGSFSFTRNAVAISAGTLTININSQEFINFDLTTTVSSAFTIALSNVTNVVGFQLTLRVTGAVAISMPSGTKMMRSETDAGRWVQGSPGVLTLTGVTASPFRLIFTFDGTNYQCEASDLYE